MRIKPLVPNYTVTCYTMVGKSTTYDQGRRKVLPIYHQHDHHFVKIGMLLIPVN